jgi:N-acetylneuraminate synthase/N,N'-diacetyllegionaminate synthase
LKIGGIDLARAPALIAEIGNNHEGDPAAARALAERALDCGAHIVKYQLIDPERLVSVDQTERVKQLARFKLPIAVYEDIARRVRARGGFFMASAFDLDSGKPVVLSTGMATLEEVEHAVATFKAALPAGAKLEERLALLHCVSLYPTRPDQANLLGIDTLRRRFGLVTGYSDHVMGIEVAAMALAKGAQLIEKHFTLDKKASSFRDHALAADPVELERLAALVRAARGILGDGAKNEAVADRESARAVRRSVVAARALEEGAVLTARDLDFVRPGSGLSPTRAGDLVGRRLRRALRRHELIRPEDLA